MSDDATKLSIGNVELVGENEHGYQFAVGTLGDRWVGFARGETSEGSMLFMFPEIAENFTMGILDRERAIRMTGAIAEDPESGYGGVDRWFVGEELRGKPDDFRCEMCERVGCDGIGCQDAIFDPGDLP